MHIGKLRGLERIFTSSLLTPMVGISCVLKVTWISIAFASAFDLLLCNVAGWICSQFQRSLSVDTDSDGFIFVSVPCYEKCIVAVQCIRQVSVPRARCARYQTVSIHSKPPQQPHGKIDKTFGAEQKQSRFYSK